MATVPSEITWVAGQVVTPAQLNANLRDAVNFIITPPMAVLRQVSTQSLATSGQWAAITWDTEDLNRDAMHSTVTNPSRVTANTAGWYHLSTTLDFAANTAGQRAVGWRINGSGTSGPTAGKEQIQALSSFDAALNTSGDVFLNVGDYIEIVGYQSSGGALSTGNSDGGSRFSIRWVST